MIGIKNRKTRLDHIKYTLDHRVAFLHHEKQLYGKVSIRGWLHDLDKVFLYALLGKEKTSKIHKKYAGHHRFKAKTEKDFREMVIDWECARYTKPDKPLNAYDTLYRYYPELEDKILPILKELKIDKSNIDKENVSNG